MLFRSRPQGAGIGKAVRLDDATGRCIEYIKSTIPRGVDFEGLKIVVDCANGAAYKITPWVFRELGAEVIAINDKPNGININDNCGSLYMDRLREEVVSAGADVGIAHDGDADRTLFCDEKGDIVDGDKAMGLLAVGLKETGHLMNDTLVSTVMSNLGLEHYLQSRGIKLVRTSVGDRYVVEKMREGGYNFGGEQSGHIVFFDHNTTGDGPITAIQMMHLLKKRRKFSDLAGEIKMYPQILENVAVGKRRSIDSIPAVTQAVEKVRRDLEGRGRILVRPSGTEPKIRIMVEGDDQRLIKECAEYISKIIADSLS